MFEVTGLLTVAADFDGSLVEPSRPLRWRHGARAFLVGAAAAGVKVWVHSCRCAPVGLREDPSDEEEFWRSGAVPGDLLATWALRREMVDFLLSEGVRGLVELWEAPGKPLADCYVDDRLSSPDWVVVAAELGVRLEHGRGGDSQVGVGPVSSL